MVTVETGLGLRFDEELSDFESSLPPPRSLLKVATLHVERFGDFLSGVLGCGCSWLTVEVLALMLLLVVLEALTGLFENLKLENFFANQLFLFSFFSIASLAVSLDGTEDKLLRF